MNEYHKNTCIRFTPKTNENDYVSIQKNGGGYDLIDWKISSEKNELIML